MKKLVLTIYALFTVIELWAQVDTCIEKSEVKIIEEPKEEIKSNEKYEYIDVFVENGKYGLKSYTTNKILLDSKYQLITRLYDIFFEIYQEGKNGIYSGRERKIVLPIEYSKISIEEFFQDSWKKRVFKVQKDGKYGIFNMDFKPILEIEYNDLQVNTPALVIVTKDSLDGVYYFSCNCFKIPIIYKKIQQMTGYGLVAQGLKSIDYFNKEGDLLFNNLKSVNDYRTNFDKNNRLNLLFVNHKNQAGLFDTKLQKFLIYPDYSSILDSYYGYYIVKKRNKFGIVNENNEIKVDFKYDSIAYMRPYYYYHLFHKPDPHIDSMIIEKILISVSKNGKFGLINRRDEVVVDLNYNQIEHINNFYKLEKDGKYLIVDLKGKKITDQEFDEVGLFVLDNDTFKAAVVNNGKIGYINSKGKIIEPINRQFKARGYKNIEELYKQFVVSLKSKEDSALYNFCKDYCPDEYSKEFMERSSFNYRGFPKELYKNGYCIEDVVKESYKTLLNFRNLLKEEGQLETLEFVKLENDNVGYEEFDTFYLLMTETPGILKSKDKKYLYKLGELINIEGYWKSFTKSRKL